MENADYYENAREKKNCFEHNVIKENFLTRSNLPPFWHTIRASLHSDASRKQRGSDVD